MGSGGELWKGTILRGTSTIDSQCFVYPKALSLIITIPKIHTFLHTCFCVVGRSALFRPKTNSVVVTIYLHSHCAWLYFTSVNRLQIPARSGCDWWINNGPPGRHSTKLLPFLIPNTKTVYQGSGFVRVNVAQLVLGWKELLLISY
jgi:hypothetical protein